MQKKNQVNSSAYHSTTLSMVKEQKILSKYTGNEKIVKKKHRKLTIAQELSHFILIEFWIF
jgi:hypothetical protein